MNRRSSAFFTGLACFTAPAVLFLALCAAMGFAPFGSSSILIFDLSDQFVEFLCALKSGDVFFSWNTALGGSYIGTFSYYVSSPFSLLTLLCPNEHMPVAVVFLVALKLGLAGFAFSLLLHRRTGRYDLTTLAFSLCYALMSYNMAYAMSFMWLDGVLWLPILLIGTEDLLDGKRPWMLLFGLVFSFVSSWYISYMAGLFCALYLLWRCICEGIPPVRCILRLAGWACLGLLLTAWLWLPTAASMFFGKLAETSSPIAIGFNWPLTTLFYKLLVPGAYDSVTYTGSAFLYCSLLAVILAALWFFLPHITKRAKLAALAVFVFLGLCLWFTPLDLVWHLFQPPHSFPGRWSFVVSCFVLLLGYDALLWLLDRVKEVRLSKLLPALLVLVLAVDMGANALLIFRGLDADLHFDSYASYSDYKTTMQPLIDEIKSDNRFQRVTSDIQRSRNEPVAFGYKGLTFFSSSYNAGVNKLLNDLGFAQNWFWSTSLGSTPVSDLLLGVGYHISDHSKPLWYTPVSQSGGLTLSRTKLTPAPAYFTAQNLLAPIRANQNAFVYQNDLLSALSGETMPAFLSLDALRSDEELSTTWTVVSNGDPMYGYFAPVEGHNASLYINGVLYSQVYTNETDCILYLGTFPTDETVEITLITTAPLSHRLNALYTLDTTVLTRAAEALSQNAMQVTACSNGSLKGTIVAKQDGWLYTSVPAIPGWTVRVDGKTVKHQAFLDTLLTIPVTAGPHTVSMHYTPPGFFPGLALTGLGALITAVLLLKKRRQ